MTWSVELVRVCVPPEQSAEGRRQALPFRDVRGTCAHKASRVSSLVQGPQVRVCWLMTST